MLYAIFRWFFRVKGWKVDPEVPQEALGKCVIIAAPHTTWWDIVYTYAALEMIGVKIRITVADKYTFWPIKKPLERMGAIWIDRRPKVPGTPRQSYVDTMIALYKDHDQLAVVVTPEGTRSYRDEWKLGFYHVAKGAGVPIGLGYLDYRNKIAGVGGVVHPSGDMAEDLAKVMDFYANIPAKFPERFSVDKRYWRGKSGEETPQTETITS